MSKLVTGGTATISAEQLADLICEIANLKNALENSVAECHDLRKSLGDILPFAEAANRWMDSDYGYYRDKFEEWKDKRQSETDV